MKSHSRQPAIMLLRRQQAASSQADPGLTLPPQQSAFICHKVMLLGLTQRATGSFYKGDKPHH